MAAAESAKETLRLKRIGEKIGCSERWITTALW